MDKRPHIPPSARRIARGAIHWLEDTLSARADRQPNGLWIPVDPHALGPEPSDQAAAAQDDTIDWQQGPAIGTTGVCRLEQAKVRFFAPNRHQPAASPPRRGAVFTRHSRRLAYPHAARILAHQIRDAVSRNPLKPHTTTRLTGRVALLGNAVGDASNYYHFWMDSIGDLLFLQQVLPAALQPDRWLLSHAGRPWQHEILDMLGIDHDRVIPFTDHTHIVADELLVPVRDKGGAHLTPGLVDCIRCATPQPASPQPPGRALYITRDDSSRRPVHNEPAVRDLVQRHGLDMHTLTGLSVARQIKLFAEADIVVATHGAGLTNLMWCQPGTTVIELLPDRHRVPCFRDICRQRNLQHHAIPCPQPGTAKALAAPMTVPLEPLATALQHHRPA